VSPNSTGSGSSGLLEEPSNGTGQSHGPPTFGWWVSVSGAMRLRYIALWAAILAILVATAWLIWLPKKRLLTPERFNSFLDKNREQQQDRSLNNIKHHWKEIWMSLANGIMSRLVSDNKDGKFKLMKLVQSAITRESEFRKLRESDYPDIMGTLTDVTLYYLAFKDFTADGAEDYMSPDGVSLVHWVIHLQNTEIDDPTGKLASITGKKEPLRICWWTVYFGFFDACNDRINRETIKRLQHKKASDPEMHTWIDGAFVRHARMETAFIDSIIKEAYRDWHNDQLRGTSTNPEIYVNRLRDKILKRASGLEVKPFE
jgi:hypothetical protein